MFEVPKGLEIHESYFQTEPFLTKNEPDYLNPSSIVHSASHWFPHTLSDMIAGSLKQGLRIKHFQEYAHDISTIYNTFEIYDTQLPLCYSLVAQKENEAGLVEHSPLR